VLALMVLPASFAPPILVTPLYVVPLIVAELLADPVPGLLKTTVPASLQMLLSVALIPLPLGCVKLNASWPPALKKYLAFAALSNVTVYVKVSESFQVLAPVAVVLAAVPCPAAFNLLL
jgi:preprotein translocase subunit SecY